MFDEQECESRTFSKFNIFSLNQVAKRRKKWLKPDLSSLDTLSMIAPQLSSSHFREFQSDPESVTFVVTRHPFQKIVSAFRDKLERIHTDESTDIDVSKKQDRFTTCFKTCGTECGIFLAVRRGLLSYIVQSIHSIIDQFISHKITAHYTSLCYLSYAHYNSVTLFTKNYPSPGVSI